MLHDALDYLASGLSVLPAIRRGSEKRVALGTWKTFQERLPTREDVEGWFRGESEDDALCIVCGRVSGNLEMIDFDLEGEAFAAWEEAVNAAAPGLIDRLVVESSPSGGLHAIYRCESPVDGNLKLAARRFACDDAPTEPLTVGTKDYTPRRDSQGYGVVVTMIETRGEGGLFLCAPSPGYAIAQGDLRSIPTITHDERDTLLSCARSLNEYHPAPLSHAPPAANRQPTAGAAGVTPGDDFNARGDVRGVLQRAGWRTTGKLAGGNEHWTRPGKDSGTSATLRELEGVSVLYVFTSNAPPFEPGKAYAPFAVVAMLEHGGDFSAAASSLRKAGYGDQTPRQGISGVNLGRLMSSIGGASAPVQTPAVASTTPDVQTIGEPDHPQPVYIADLVAQHPKLRPIVINSLIREGETMNVIAPPKTGKSWLTLDLAIAVATGLPWLERYATVPGEVLIVDNELHSETSAHRLPKVAEARGVAMGDIGRRIAVDNLRGRLKSILDLGPYFRAIDPGRFKVIILDAFYRFMPIGGDENDNGTMASIYNHIDAFANHLGCCFVLIHHSTKGNQSGKSVTDVGAGAGAQSRAADTHLVLRQHEEDGVVVLDAAVRSFAPIDPSCLRWTFPVWNYDPSLDPTELKGERPRRKADRDDARTEPWTPERFVQTFIRRPAGIDEIRSNTTAVRELTWRAVSRLIQEAERMQLIYRHKSGQGGRVTFSTTPPREGSR